MLIPCGQYRYELRRGGELLGTELDSLGEDSLVGTRRAAAPGGNRHEVEAALNPEGLVMRIKLRYTRGPFSRNASYEAQDDQLRGSVSALAGQNMVQTKLGRFHEVDGDLLLFKALLIARLRARGQKRWTARVATIDPATLVASSPKQTFFQRDEAGQQWVFETLVGDREQLELDDAGRIVRRVDMYGTETVLVGFEPA